MKRAMVSLLIISFSLFLFFGENAVAFADPLAELKEELRLTQEKLNAVQSKIEEIQKQREDDQATLLQNFNSLFKKEQFAIKFNIYANSTYENFQETDSRFTNNKVELLADIDIIDRLKGFAEIEFADAAEVGGERGGEVEMERGWLQYEIHPALRIRGGVLLVPFGYYNLSHFEVLQELSSRPLVDRRVVPTDWAEAGAGVTGEGNFGNIPWNYELYFVNGLTDEINDVDGLREARGRFGSDNNNSKGLAGRISFSPWQDQWLGVSTYLGEYDDEDHSINGLGADWQLTYKKLEVVGEYAFFDLEKGLNADDILVPEKLQGFYVEGRYRFWPAFLNETFLKKLFENPTFTALVRYGWAQIKDDGDANTGDNEESQWAFGLNYRPVETFVFKFEYLLSETKNEPLERGDNDGFLVSIAASF